MVLLPVSNEVGYKSQKTVNKDSLTLYAKSPNEQRDMCVFVSFPGCQLKELTQCVFVSFCVFIIYLVLAAH